VAFPDLVATMDRAVRDNLGVPVRYAPLPGSATFVDAQGIFDSVHHRPEPQGAMVTATVPAVFVLLSALGAFDPDTDPDPSVTVAGKVYKVRESRKDGQGGVLLLLQER
jgi:hypothetical protein